MPQVHHSKKAKVTSTAKIPIIAHKKKGVLPVVRSDANEVINHIFFKLASWYMQRNLYIHSIFFINFCYLLENILQAI